MAKAKYQRKETLSYTVKGLLHDTSISDGIIIMRIF